MRAKEFISGTKLHIPTNQITNESIIDFLTQSSKYMPTKQRLKIVESMAENNGKLLTEILNNDMADDIINLLSSLTVKKAEIGEKYIPVSLDIFNDTIVVYDVIRNSPPQNNAEFGILISETETEFSLKIDDNVYNYPIMERANYLMMITGLFDTVENYNKFSMVMKLKYDVELLPFNSSESDRSSLVETLKSLRLPNMEIRIDMDHIVSRMKERNLVSRYKEVDILLRNLPMDKIDMLDPGQQFWIWDSGRRIGLGFRKLNSIPTLMLKTAISSPPKGDRNPTIEIDTSALSESKLNVKTLSVAELVKIHDVPKKQIIDQLNKGIKVELEHTSDRTVAKEIALDHLKEFPDYYDRLAKAEKVDESASGYIPSEKEKNDPRFKTALTKDVRPGTLKKNAKAFGFNVSRAGIPPTLR